jgi:hypothetical protein
MALSVELLYGIALVQAADSGWNRGQAGMLGFDELDLSRINGEFRKVQAWLFDSLNKGSLARRLQTLILMKSVLQDWYFPWALLRQETQLTDLLAEVLKVSQSPRPRILLSSL